MERYKSDLGDAEVASFDESDEEIISTSEASLGPLGERVYRQNDPMENFIIVQLKGQCNPSESYKLIKNIEKGFSPSSLCFTLPDMLTNYIKCAPYQAWEI